jgi:hypothetical protein
MANPHDRQIMLEIVVRSAHPALLEGLDEWLRLGLISDDWVRRICAQQLVCSMPQVVIPAVDLGTRNAAGQSEESQADFLPPVETRPGQGTAPRVERSLASEPARQAPARQEQSPGLVSQAMRSFMAEVSVMWLLFLGVFLVVLSSGVLAATQWRNFSTVGQYGILFGYTAAFWLVSVWTGRQESLRLTTRMLKIAALLLVPVNFWMMDGFRLWNSGLGIGLAGVAAIGLTVMTLLLLRPNQPWLLSGVAIALSWLHWGWSGQGIPFAAVYLGTISTAIAVVLQDRSRPPVPKTSANQSTSDDPPLQSAPPVSLNTIALVFGAFLLIGRALLRNQVPIEQLGLAIGVGGWLVCWLARRDRDRTLWNWGGVVLLLIGWSIAIPTTPPWQAIAISGLALWLLAIHLGRSSQLGFLVGLWLVGLQTCWLLWRMIPEVVQQQVIRVAAQLAGTQGMPTALLGLGLFSYVLLTLGAAAQFHRWQKLSLRQGSESLALGLGAVLTLLSSFNPLVRSLNLVLSTLTLLGVLFKRLQPGAWLVYLTHATGLGTIVSLIDWRFPALNANQWAAVLTAGMVIEWGVMAVSSRQDGNHRVSSRAENRVPANEETESRSPINLFSSAWSSSGWYYGLVLAVLTYLVLWSEYTLEQFLGTGKVWGWLALAAPIALTILGNLPWFRLAQLASWLSVVAAIFMQPLLFATPAERMVSLGIATVLMLFNTRRVQHVLAAILTIGFGLAFVSVLVSDTVGKTIDSEWVLCLLAIAVLLLWLFRGWLVGKAGDLAKIYRGAADGWAIAIALTILPVVTLMQFVIYIGFAKPDWRYTLVAGILLIASFYRIWRSGRIALNFGLLGAAWSLELLVASGLSLAGRSLDAIGIANLALGLATQLVGDWWQRGQDGQLRQAEPSQGRQAFSAVMPGSLHLIPLLYAAIGVLIQHHAFTATTGLYTLAAALTGVGVGRRSSWLKVVTVLALLVGSGGVFELLVYQLTRAKGGSAGDGIVLLAALAIGLAIAYLLAQRLLVPYLRLKISELRAIAHLHYVLGNILLLAAFWAPLSSSGKWLATAIGVGLASYALAIGREGRGQRAEGRSNNEQLPSNETADQARLQTEVPNVRSHATSNQIWTLVGLIQGLAAFAHILYLALPSALLLDWGGAIAAFVAIPLYFFPWQRFGWDRQPGRAIAVILPIFILLMTAVTLNIQSLLIGAAFYAWLANAERQPRISYLSVLLGDWAILRWLDNLGAQEVIWYAAVLGSSVLYIAQVDPALTGHSDREKRHWVRCGGAALVCFAAFYQSQVGIATAAPFWVGLGAIALQLSFALAGIIFRIRAFLYVGTLAFILQTLWQLWRFIDNYPALLWALGIAVGLILIWAAATFEARRTQMNALLQHWMIELNAWN